MFNKCRYRARCHKYSPKNETCNNDYEAVTKHYCGMAKKLALMDIEAENEPTVNDQSYEDQDK